MNKTELVAAIAERTELTKKDADQALKLLLLLLLLLSLMLLVMNSAKARRFS